MRRLFILPAVVWLAAGPLLRPALASGPGTDGAVVVTVEGDSPCPSPPEVSGRVSALLADDSRPTAPARAHVDRAGAELRVRLADDRGAAIAERRLPATDNCGEMAEVVAVTIATWLGQLRPERLPIPMLQSPPSPPRAAAPTTNRSPVGWELGAGAKASLAEGGLAAGGNALLSVHAGLRGAGVLLRAGGTTRHQVTVGAHTALWRRWDIAVGPSYQFPVGAWRLTTSVGLSAGWLSAQGRDFPQNQTSNRFSPGLSGLIQLGHPFGGWTPWLSVGASAAIYNEPLLVTGSTDQRTLRPLELEIGLGASVRWLQ